MTLRKKTLVIIGATFIGLVVILYLVSRSILIGSFAELEEQDTHQNVERVLTALSGDVSLLDATVGDWASWDDTYAFIKDTNTDVLDQGVTEDLNRMIFSA